MDRNESKQRWKVCRGEGGSQKKAEQWFDDYTLIPFL